jgi:hypothetical protein
MTRYNYRTFAGVLFMAQRLACSSPDLLRQTAYACGNTLHISTRKSCHDDIPQDMKRLLALLLIMGYRCLVGTEAMLTSSEKRSQIIAGSGVCAGFHRPLEAQH